MGRVNIMELSPYSKSEHKEHDSPSISASPLSPSSDLSSSSNASSGRNNVLPNMRNFLSSQTQTKPIILGSENTSRNTSSSNVPRQRTAWRTLLDPRPFTEFMALNFGMMGGLSLTGSSIGGIIAGAGLGLVFGLGAAGVVAVGWELCSPGRGREGEGSGGDKGENSSKEIQEWEMGDIELDDLGKSDGGKGKFVGGGE
ncbi:hypothetical protein DL95DRAFT_475272 [Leptodontidium sp. 2 PMI_412]|nr:hypothetical protein DL95DRAFT_475272 [Leptodontidium sp. 2 PMI_412]